MQRIQVLLHLMNINLSKVRSASRHLSGWNTLPKYCKSKLESKSSPGDMQTNDGSLPSDDKGKVELLNAAYSISVFTKENLDNIQY